MPKPMSVEVLIDAPIERVWSIITDIDNCVDHIEGIQSVEILDRPSSGVNGLKWRETRVMNGKEASEEMEIVESEPQSYYRTYAENHGAIYRSEMRVNTANDQTRLSMTFSAEPQSMLAKIMSWVFSTAMAKSLSAMMLKDLNDIKAVAEKAS